MPAPVAWIPSSAPSTTSACAAPLATRPPTATAAAALAPGFARMSAFFSATAGARAAWGEANQSLAAGFHVHVAEDRCDPAAVRRLCDAGVLNEKALAAHCIHLAAADRNRSEEHTSELQ